MKKRIKKDNRASSFNKTKILIIILVALFLIFCVLVVWLFISFKMDKEQTNGQMSKVNDVYDEFSLEIDNFNDVRNQLYLDVFENTYYDSLSTNDVKFKEAFTNYEKIVDVVVGKALRLEKYCKNVYYADSKVNTKCNEYGVVYEQVINAFVSDVKLYNKNIENYNEYQSDNGGTLFLNSYVTKKKYLDYNGDKKYQGKEE